MDTFRDPLWHTRTPPAATARPVQGAWIQICSCHCGRLWSTTRRGRRLARASQACAGSTYTHCTNQVDVTERHEYRGISVFSTTEETSRGEFPICTGPGGPHGAQGAGRRWYWSSEVHVASTAADGLPGTRLPPTKIQRFEGYILPGSSILTCGGAQRAVVAVEEILTGAMILNSRTRIWDGCDHNSRAH